MSNKLSRLSVEYIFQEWERQNPFPRTELSYSSPYTLLVAVVLSAQATDVSVNRVTTALFQAADTPSAMVRLGEKEICEKIRSLGLFRNKAKNLVSLSQQLIERHGGQVPSERKALEALSGVGRKTSNVVLSEAFGQTTIAVDTHVFRVARRIGLASGQTEIAVETELLKTVPRKYQHQAHHWLILHGRYICKARKPICPECSIKKWCVYPEKVLPRN